MTRSPRDAEVHIGLGKALEKQNRVKEAERSFREALVVEPGYWAVYNALGGFLFGQGRNREAAEAYAHLTELAPRSATGYNNLGAALLASGEFQASAKAFETSTEIEPSRSAYSNLGTLYYYLGRLEEAVGMYGKGLEIAPEDYQLWGARADSLWYLPQQRQRALEDYRRAAALAEKNLAVDATDGEVWALLGFYYGRLGDHERSVRYVDRAIELEPGSPYVNYFAAISAADRGDRKLATQRIRQAIESGYSRLLAVPDPALKGIPIG
jgi:tetratricopeptide (TPR) repeat protein